MRATVAAPPAGTVMLGGFAEICGATGGVVVTCAVRDPDVADPGFGFVTLTEMFPVCEPETDPTAVSFDEETNVVCSTAVPKFTVAPVTKLLPEAVIVKAPIPSCEGEIEESCGIGFSTVSVAVLLNEEAELTDAVTVTELGLGIWDGAVYCAANPPVEAIEPTEELPFCRPFTSQVISGLLTPVTTAVNCCVAPARTVIVAGEIVMV